MRFYCWSKMGQDPLLSAMHQCVLMPNYSHHLLGRVAMHSVRCGYCWRCFVVSVCVCVSHTDTTVSLAKTDEPIDVPFSV